MITVQMTKDIQSRPPRIMGLFTKRQLIGLLAAAAVMLILLIALPFSIGTNFLISLVPAVPVLIIAYYPENQTSPIVYVKYYIKRAVYGKDVRLHDGNSNYYIRPKQEKEAKIKRHREYQGIR